MSEYNNENMMMKKIINMCFYLNAVVCMYVNF